MAANFAQVARFCRIVPQRSPTTLIQVTSDDRNQRHNVGAGENDSRGGEDNVLLGNRGDNSAQICRRCHRERGDRAAVGHAEQHPAVEECGQVSVGFAQINVLAAGVGKHRAQFGEGGASQQGNARAQHPDQQEQHGMRQRAGDVFRGQENRRADDASAQQQDGIEQAESANQAGRFGFRRWKAKRPKAGSLYYPIPSSSGDSSGVPQRRQMTAEQSPQVSGSVTSWLHRGQ